MKYLVIVSCLVASVMHPMYEYRKAEEADLHKVLALINQQAVYDSDKIVILPRDFREKSILGAIDKKRLFVACDNDRIVGYKKLFLLNDEKEKQEILSDELRCLGKKAVCSYSGIIDDKNVFIQTKNFSPLIDAYTSYIYDGADFTLSSYRCKGINSTLTTKALEYNLDMIQKHIDDHASKCISLVYGITQDNAGEIVGVYPDRTPSILKSFKKFISVLEKRNDPISLEHYRYEARKPTFDPESKECKPLPDEQSIPGFGCVLTYTLKKENNE